MSSFRVQLDDQDPPPRPAVRDPEPAFDSLKVAPRRSRRPFVIAGIVLLSLVAVTGLAGLLYYQSLKKTPQYSLALLVDAAKRDDKAQVDSLIDINTVVDDFVPQVTDKAIELYGKGLNPKQLSDVTRIAAPILPAVKDRARAELPRVIRERTERFGNVPFFAMVMGADRYLDIKVTGDTALIKSKMADHPLEMTMRRTGDRWQIVGVKDERVATDIARKIGQEIITLAMNGGINSVGDRLGVKNLTDILRQAGELVQ